MGKLLAHWCRAKQVELETMRSIQCVGDGNKSLNPWIRFPSFVSRDGSRRAWEIQAHDLIPKENNDDNEDDNNTHMVSYYLLAYCVIYINSSYVHLLVRSVHIG